MLPRRRAIYALAPVLALVLIIGATASAENGNDEILFAQVAPPNFPGMAPIPEGPFKMGIDQKDLEALVGKIDKPNKKSHILLKGQDKDFWRWFLLTETPEHKVETEAYSIDIHTVTNAQYRVFLEQTAKGTFFTTTKIRTIAAVKREIFGDTDDPWLAEMLYWVNVEKLTGIKDQVYELNKAQVKTMLDEFNEFRPDRAKVKTFDEIPDKQKVGAWLDFLLPEGVALTVYYRVIPDNWPKAKLPAEMKSLPVVFVSAIDAEAFAVWAGKHLPNEAQWERAARGPKSFIFPWGPKWDILKKQRNILLWVDAGTVNEKGGIAPPFKDGPIDVTKLPAGASAYGLHHMLGNVSEWTSSLPGLYAKSKAEKKSWFGSPNLRVVRSTNYGTGNYDSDSGTELMIRNTTRLMSMEVGGIPADKRFQAIGFRCAKYPRPTRDVIEFHHARLREKKVGAKTKDRLDPKSCLGVELPKFVAGGGKHQEFVGGETLIVSAVPFARLEESQATKVIENSMDPAKPPHLFAWLMWNGDLKIEILRRKLIEKKAPAEGEGETPAAEEKKDDKKAKDDKKSKKDKKKKPDRKKKNGKKKDPVAEEVPEGPQYEEVREFLSADTKNAYYVGIFEGRLAIFLQKALKEEFVGFLPVQTAAGQKAGLPVITKGSPKAWRPSAVIDPKTGFVKFKLLIQTRSKSSDDIFIVDVVLKVQGEIDGTWRQMPN
jgi:formylglycine-generating enzyme required for sulfatase activity